jgi:hypothetical protein
MIEKTDLKQLEIKGIKTCDVEQQIEQFKKGFPYSNLSAPATIGNGILHIAEESVEKYQKLHRKMLSHKRVVKFVPASGAATRMFQKVYEMIQHYDDSYDKYLSLLVDRSFNSIFYVCENMKLFAFYRDLCEMATAQGESLETRLAKKDYVYALNLMLSDNGLNYGSLPKGLLKFHKYKGGSRTAAEEHLVEGAQHASCNGKVAIHFTVSPEHMDPFKKLMETAIPKFEEQLGVKFQIEYSIQDPATDTIAVTKDNEPFRNPDGTLLFRPAGHGALLTNLGKLNYDVVFVKNIDNIVTDRLKPDTIKYKEIIGGILFELQDRVAAYLTRLENPDSINDSTLSKMVNFSRKRLNNPFPYKLGNATRQQKVEWLKQTLDRPLRICGMVRNEGEPGGGPFWVKDENGVDSLQIVETSQMDPRNKTHKEMLKNATHFNPVDLVCYITDYKGKPFDLLKFRDDNTGFISTKSKDGKELKALELPGLWNGAMAKWNTVFVEVPISTFNPVKTINDLLRQEHLYEKDLMERTKPQ